MSTGISRRQTGCDASTAILLRLSYVQNITHNALYNSTRRASEHRPLCQGKYGPGCGVRIRIISKTNLAGTSVSRYTFMVKFLWRSDHRFGDMRQIVWKCPISQCWSGLQIVSGCGCWRGWLPTLNRSFRVHVYISGKILEEYTRLIHYNTQ